MNKKLLIITGGIVTIGLVVLLLVWLWSKETPPTVIDPGQVSFPIPSGGSTPGQNISITTASGGNMQTKDFIKAPETIKDPFNAGHYYLGNHFAEGQTKEPPYVIEYIESTNYFNVGLFQEPIAQSRKQAEQYLMEHLGISQNQMCQLKYMVSVPTDVNEFYSSINLGFSFCPGSVAIPE